jgi:18S rRNA (adenine1779-N6/adenine1780-N6)-dimethyltransferase
VPLSLIPLTHPTHSHQNYKVYCSLHNIPIDESLADATATAADDDMDVDMDDNAAGKDDDDEAAADNGMDEDEDDDEDMPTFFKELKDADAAREAAKTPSRNPKSKVALVVKAKVAKVLAGTALGEKRARQCDQNDFLKLLLGEFSSLDMGWGMLIADDWVAFHEEGIHFS